MLSVVATVIARVQTTPLLDDQRLCFNMLAFVLWRIGAFAVSFGTRAFRQGPLPSLFLVLDRPNSSIPAKPDRKAASGGLGCLCTRSVRDQWCALSSRRDTNDDPWVNDRGCPGVEQYPVRSDVSGHNHGSGPDASGLILAKSLVIAVAVPLWVAKNGLRIFVLAMLGTRVDRSFLTGKLHHQGGIIYFLIALAAISFLIWIARYSNRNRRVLAETNH